VYATSTPIAPGVLYTASCGNSSQNLKWIWQPVSVYSSTTYGSADTGYAVDSWNVAQSTVGLTTSSSVYDIIVGDGDPAGTGTSSAFLYSGACNPCYNQVDTCTGACVNSSSLYGANIYLNHDALDNESSVTGYSIDSLVIPTIIHEVGHTFGLDEVLPPNHTCSETDSIMAGVLSDFCGITGATSLDIATLNSVYPVAPNYCLPGYNYCYGTSCY
jgi:hypothetical protein